MYAMYEKVGAGIPSRVTFTLDGVKEAAVNVQDISDDEDARDRIAGYLSALWHVPDISSHPYVSSGPLRTEILNILSVCRRKRDTRPPVYVVAKVLDPFDF